MLKSIPAIAAVAMIAAMTLPAAATEWIFCSNVDDTASIGVLAGGLDFSQFSRATLSVGNDDWATHPSIEPGTPLRIADSFFDWNQLIVTLADEDANEILAELRVYLASEGNTDAKAGVLRIPGRGAWPVICEGP